MSIKHCEISKLKVFATLFPMLMGDEGCEQNICHKNKCSPLRMGGCVAKPVF